MYQQRFKVTTARESGGTLTRTITSDQRDLAQLELTDWHVPGRTMTNGLRFLVYSAMRRQSLIGDVSWDTFNTGALLDVQALDDDEPDADDDDDGEGEQGLDPGQTTTDGGRSSTSPSPQASPSPRAASRRGTRAT